MIPERPSEAVSLTLQRLLNASPERVFDALTQPSQLMQWWAVSAQHRASIAEIELVVGGRYRLGMRGPSGTEYVVAGVFHEIVPPRRLVYSWEWEHETVSAPGLETRVEIELYPTAKGGTELRLTHQRFRSAENANQHQQGWLACFEHLESVFDF